MTSSFKAQSKLATNPIENLKKIKTDNWNNVAIPIVDAINIIVHEVGGVYSQIDQ